MQHFEATMNLAMIGVLCILVTSTSGKSFILLSYFKVNLFAVFDVSFNKFLLRLLRL